jgi:hypothetical protein
MIDKTSSSGGRGYDGKRVTGFRGTRHDAELHFNSRNQSVKQTSSIIIMRLYVFLALVFLIVMSLAHGSDALHELPGQDCAPICEDHSDGSISCVSGCPPHVDPETGITQEVDGNGLAED